MCGSYFFSNTISFFFKKVNCGYKMVSLAISGTGIRPSPAYSSPIRFCFPKPKSFISSPSSFSLILHLHHHCKLLLPFIFSNSSSSVTHFLSVSTEDAHQLSPVLLSSTSSPPSAAYLLPHRHFFTLFTLSVSLSLLCSLLPVVVVAIVTNSNIQATMQR